MKTGQALTDYVTTTLPLPLVKRALTILAEDVNDPRLDAFTLALEDALVLDHQRVSLASIVEVLGDLGQGDALRAIAVILSSPENGPAAAIAMRRALDRWDSWARSVTGRSSLKGVGRPGIRNEIAVSLTGTPMLRRERNDLLDTVRALADDEGMTVEAAVVWLRELDLDQT